MTKRILVVLGMMLCLGATMALAQQIDEKALGSAVLKKLERYGEDILSADQIKQDKGLQEVTKSVGNIFNQDEISVAKLANGGLLIYTIPLCYVADEYKTQKMRISSEKLEIVFFPHSEDLQIIIGPSPKSQTFKNFPKARQAKFLMIYRAYDMAADLSAK